MDAVAYVHGGGEAHMDDKAENLVVDGGGQVKLTDIGTASTAGSAAPAVAAGTAADTAAGVVATAGAAGPAAEVISAGVVLYQHLFGRRRFGDGDGSRAAVLVPGGD